MGPPEFRTPGTEGGKVACLGRDFDDKTAPTVQLCFGHENNLTQRPGPNFVMTTAVGHEQMASGVATGLGNYPKDRGRTLISMKQAEAGGRGKSDSRNS